MISTDMDHTWTAVFCVTLAFFSGASSVRLLIGRWNGIIQWYDTETQESKIIVKDSYYLTFDYNFSKGHIYYSDGNNIKRHSIDPNLKDLKVIVKVKVDRNRGMYGMAVDWINNNIYWTRSNDVVLEKADLDGNCQTSIITKSILEQVEGLCNINILYSIEVDPYERMLFMIAGSDWPFFNGTFVKSDLEGKNLTVVVTHEKYKKITDFAIDRLQKILYVVYQTYQDKYNSIYSCKYNGDVIKEFSVCPEISVIYPVAMFRQNMYMGIEKKGGKSCYGVHVKSLSSVKYPSELLGSDKFISRINDIKVYDVDVQQPLNVYNSYQRIKQRFSNWDKCLLLSTEWERIDCLEGICNKYPNKSTTTSRPKTDYNYYSEY